MAIHRMVIPILEMVLWVSDTRDSSKRLIRSRCSDDELEGLMDDVKDCRGIYVEFSGKLGKHRLLSVFDDRNNTLVHEASHASRRLLDECGIPVRGKQDEMAACLTGYIVEHVSRIMPRLSNEPDPELYGETEYNSYEDADEV